MRKRSFGFYAQVVRQILRAMRIGLQRSWPFARWLVGLAIVALTWEVLSSHRGELHGLSGVVSHLNWFFVLLAVGFEILAIFSTVMAQSRLLGRASLLPLRRTLFSTTLASNAIANSVPAGPAVAAVYLFRWYRRFGADDPVAAWVVVGVNVASFCGLALVALGGLGLASSNGASLNLVPAVIGVAVVALVAALLFVSERPLSALIARQIERNQRGRQTARRARILAILSEMARLRLSPLDFSRIVGWAFGNWLWDAGAFAVAFLATGTRIPWAGLLLTYGAGQLAANLPVTPGGLGAVEGSLTAALSYFGGVSGKDVAAILIYRIVSFWLPVGVGWLNVGGLSLAVRAGRYDRYALNAPVAPGVIALESPTPTRGNESLSTKNKN
jgi:hypothetical protein